MKNDIVPKRLRAALTGPFADRVETFYMEHDEFDGRSNPWSIWIELKDGWHNAVLDPGPGLHTIHEPTARDALEQLKGIKPCNCDDCVKV